MRTKLGDVDAALPGAGLGGRRNTARRACAPAAALALAVALGACGKGEPAATAPAEAAKPATEATAGRSTSAKPANVSAITKFNDYIDAYNKLVGTFGLRETYERYREAHFATAKPTASLNFNEGWVYQALPRSRRRAPILPTA